jgi:hypothetical protein
MKKVLLFAALILYAGFLTVAQTVTKQLYLSSSGQILDRVDPVATGDLSTAQTNVLYGSGGFETITQVGAPASSNAAQTASTHSFAYNSGSTGTSRVMLVGISYLNANNTAVSSINYGGQVMTLVGDLNYNNGGSTYYTRVYIYRLIAPLTGSNTLALTWSGALSQGAVVGAITYNGVNQSTPTGTFASSSGNNTTPSVTVTGATGRVMFGVVSGQTTSAYNVTNGGTQLWSSMPYSGQTTGNAQSKPGATSVDLTWSGANRRWAASGVSLYQATKITSASFIQSPVLCSNLIIKAGTITVTNYISIVNGSMPANPSVTAVLKYGATTIITLSNPVYNSGNNTLTWTASLGADVTVSAGQAISLDITNTQVSGDFLIEYDSQAKPSKIDLPVSTFINVNSVDVYNAAYPSGTIVTISPGGATRYLRSVVSDPFGPADITALNYTITPTGYIVAGTQVATSGCTNTYEYVWTTPGVAGAYNIDATAKEGYENTVTHSKNTTHTICSICPPIAQDDTATCSGGSPVTIDVLANDYGISSGLNPASLDIIIDPNNGSAYIASGKIIYLPNGTYSGKDTLTYQICDLSSPVPLCATARVIITIDPLIIDICGNASKTHTYYIPYPEQNAYTALQASASNTLPSNDIRTVISLKMPYPGMRIVWDEWEDGYEINSVNPVQTTTKIWGDGNPYNGIAPGYPSDNIPAGGSLVLDNTMPANPRNSSNFFYDGKDKITASGQIAMTQVCGEPTNMPVQAIKTNITSVYDFGQSFTIPFGQNFNSRDFQYTSLFIRASQNNTTINVDKDNDGTFESTTVLNEGNCLFINGGVLTGATVASDKPIGVEVNAGGVDDFSIRNAPIFPATWYSNIYYTPVPTSDNAGDSPKDSSVVMLYNSLSQSMDINWYSGIPSSGIITIPAKSAVRFPLAYSTTASYKFVNVAGKSFTAIEIVDSYTPGGGGNSGLTYDWSFNLIAESRLTDYATVAWAPGGLDLDATPGPDVNGNPIWVTPSINTTVYVKYDGNISGTGGLVSPCGLKYDVSYSLNALNYIKIKDPNDNDQGGIAIYTCNGAKIAAVYGEDPEGSSTGIGVAYWDVGATIQPFCKQKLIFAKDDFAQTLINQPVTISVLKNDGGFLAVIDPATLNNTGVLQPKHGTVSINSNGTILFKPTPGYTGIDTFEYNICSTPSPIVCTKARVFVKITGCPADNNQNVISGQVFWDRNKDGIKNDNGAGFPGIKVYLYTDGNCNGIIDLKEKADSVIVDSSGFYQFVKYPEKIIADNFDLDAGGNSCATGTDGNVPWTTSWTDTGDPSVGFCNSSQSAANTDVEVINNTGFGYGLRLKDKNRSAQRMINLTGVTKAFLSFSYMKKSTTLSSSDEVYIQASSNGGAYTTIFTIKGDGTADNTYMPVINQDISNYISATTYIRFLTNNSLSDNDTVYFDDVSIRYLNYPQCYIVAIAASSIPADAYCTTVQQRNINIASSGTCSSALDFGIAKNTIGISGKLYNDDDGLKDNNVDGAAIGSLNGTTVFIYLTDNKGIVINKTTVAADGTFNFPLADVNTNYNLVASIVEVNIYDEAPVENNIPSDWVFTGEDFGSNNSAGSGVDGGNADGTVQITTGLSNVNNVFVGAERLPDSDNKLYFINSPALNSFMTLNGTGLMPGPLSGADPEDGILGANNNVHITSLPTGNNQLYYNNILITKGQDGLNPPSDANPFVILNYTPALLKVKFGQPGSKFIEFNYAFLDAADKRKNISATYRIDWTNPLPVKLISFDAVVKDNSHVDLSWATVTEINLDHFVVERSTDGVNFSDVGNVLATGNTTTRTDYVLTDNVSAVASAILYYRLRSVDIDNKIQYSDIRVIRLIKQQPGSINITVFPNPVTTELRMTIPPDWQNKKVQYELFSSDGSLVKKSTNSSSSQTETLNVSELSRGLYVIKVTCEGQAAQQKIVKQ